MKLLSAVISAAPGHIDLDLSLDASPLPIRWAVEMTPHAALQLAGQLEAAVHTAFPQGVPPTQPAIQNV